MPVGIIGLWNNMLGLDDKCLRVFELFYVGKGVWSEFGSNTQYTMCGFYEFTKYDGYVYRLIGNAPEDEPAIGDWVTVGMWKE